MKQKIIKSDEEWRAQLTPEEYEVTRCQGTEPPFTNKYWTETRKGVYHCICCDQPLFKSEDKFACDCGWPSFTAAIDPDAIETQLDESHGRIRTEVHCSQCDAHLGHVFEDGPPPTGLRYCIDSVAIKLKPEE